MSEITGFTTNVISSYFAPYELDTKLLDSVKILLNTDPGSLDHLVDFNNHTGILSTASLRDQVKALIKNQNYYDSFFEPRWPYQKVDNVYSPDELSVSHLGNIPATSENLESLFYGT